MFCPHCNSNEGISSRSRNISGGDVEVIVCRSCEKILGVVNSRRDIERAVEDASRQ